MEVRLANKEDIKDILKLLSENHVNNMSEEDKKNGFVTTNMTEEQMLKLIEKEKGITIAEEKDKVIAFAMAGSWTFWKEWPFFENMIRILPDYKFESEKLTVNNSYQYGPICVDKTYRGQGVFEKVFEYSLSTMKDKFPIMITFVNKINPRSYKAHSEKVNMKTLGEFEYNNNNYYIMGCYTK